MQNIYNFLRFDSSKANQFTEGMSVYHQDEYMCVDG